MFEELNHLVLSGESYPIKCDLVVLEKIQEEFGSIDTFEDRLIPWKPLLDKDGKKAKEDGEVLYVGKMPDMKAVNSALYYMADEGEKIEAELQGRKPNAITREQIIRKVDLSPRDVADQLHDEYLRCFKIKNEKTTQNQTETTTDSK